VQKHIEDVELVLVILQILSEMLRFCDCCMPHIPREQVYTAVTEAQIPEMCLSVMKK
jgi:hypothetical protein